MPPRKDPLRLALSVGLYGVTFWAAQIALFWILGATGALGGVTLSTLAGALFANWLALRVYEDQPLWVVGLYGGRAAVRNALVGVAGGGGAAFFVLAPPLALGLAHFSPSSSPPSTGTIP